MENRFSVLDHNYMNTGGHTMVSVFTVYDREAKALRYVVANDEGMNWQTMNNVSEEPADDVSWEEITLLAISWDDLKWSTYEKNHPLVIEEYRLFKHCQFEFYKKYCKTFNTKIELVIDDLPEEIVNQLTDDAVSQHNQNEWTIMTDGESIELNPLYVDEQHRKVDEELQQIKDFKRWLDDLVDSGFVNEDIQELYDKHFTISFNGKCVELYFGAAEYQAISDALAYVIEQW